MSLNDLKTIINDLSGESYPRSAHALSLSPRASSAGPLIAETRVAGRDIVLQRVDIHSAASHTFTIGPLGVDLFLNGRFHVPYVPPTPLIPCAGP